MTNAWLSPHLLLVSVGILVGIFSQGLVSAFPNNGLGTSSSKLAIPRVGINRSSKDNGFSASRAEYATHRPYKTDFDLLRASERSQEIVMPVLRNNELDVERDPEFILALDPTLRSRRRRQAPHQTIVQPSTVSSPSNMNLCHPYFSTNPMCRQNMFFGVPSNANNNVNMMGQPALSVPSSASAIFIPSTSFPSSSLSGSGFPIFGALNTNDMAILNYYQQQFTPPQAPIQQQQETQPDERQRYEDIHTKYPYPYPPTQDVNPNAPASGVPESVNAEGQDEEQVVTTAYPSDTTTYAPPSEAGPQDPAHMPPMEYPSERPSPPSPVVSSPSPQPEAPSTFPDQPDYPMKPAHQVHLEQLALALREQLREKDEENRQLRSQLEQANLQVVSYEQENAVYKEFKDQYTRAEDANVKLRDRVLQLENTNQHLQEQYGQLQQVNSEQRQQINGLKDTQKELMTQVEDFQSQITPLAKEVQRHRKEVEDFLIRIRKLGEENETMKKQVKLYQLKINYIQEQQKQQQPPQASQKKDKPPAPPVTPVLVAHVDDDLDPELMRMDAEIAALQKNAEELAVAIKNLPQPPQPIRAGEPNPVVVLKKENEFPGEAVQVNPGKKQEQTSAPASEAPRAPSASRNLPTWEKPAGF